MVSLCTWLVAGQDIGGRPLATHHCVVLSEEHVGRPDGEGGSYNLFVFFKLMHCRNGVCSVSPMVSLWQVHG